MNAIRSAQASAVVLLALAGCAIPDAGPAALSRITVTEVPGDGQRVAVVHGCPDFSRSSREDFSNRDASNFGCADAVDFIAQLADPLDALRGRGTGAQEGGAATAAIERYRAGKTTPLATGSTSDAVAAPTAGGPS